MSDRTHQYDRLDEPAYEEVRDVLSDVVENADVYEVGDIERFGSTLTVHLHNYEEQRDILVEIDENP